MSNDDIERRVAHHLQYGFSTDTPSADLERVAVDRVHRRRRNRQITTVVGSAALVVLLVTVALPRLLASEEPQVLLTNPPAEPTTALTPPAVPLSEAAQPDDIPEAPLTPQPDDTPEEPLTPQPDDTPEDATSADPSADPDVDVAAEDQRILLSNGGAIGIRTGTGDLIETLVTIPPGQIESRLGTVAVRPGSTAETLVFAYERQSEAGSEIVVAAREAGGALSEESLPGLADFINGLARLGQSPVFTADGTLFWLLHGPDGLPALGVATIDGEGAATPLTGQDGLPLPLPGLPSDRLEDVVFTLDLAVPSTAGDGGNLATVTVAAEHSTGNALPTTRFTFDIAQDGGPDGMPPAIVAGPTVVEPEGIDGQPIVDATVAAGADGPRWTLIGQPICSDAGCVPDPSTRYRLTLGTQTEVPLPEAFDSSIFTTAPDIAAISGDVLVTGFSGPGEYAPVHRISAAGNVTALPFTALSVDVIDP